MAPDPPPTPIEDLRDQIHCCVHDADSVESLIEMVEAVEERHRQEIMTLYRLRLMDAANNLDEQQRLRDQLLRAQCHPHLGCSICEALRGTDAD